MSLLSQFAPFAGGGIKSIQTGYLNYVNASSGTTGTEDERFFDVTISAVSTGKAVPDFFGTSGSSASTSGYYFVSTNSLTSSVRPRFTSGTNLRLSTFGNFQGGSPAISGRWYVIESN
jgi:hypothetical protein